MPCVSGRSQHVLIKRNCPSGCRCCINTAYSCGKLCCDEPLDNSKDCNTNCDLVLQFLQSIPGLPCEDILEELIEDSSPFIMNNIDVRLERRNLTQGDTTIFDIINGIPNIIVIGVDPTAGDELLLLVDNVECVRCTDGQVSDMNGMYPIV
jgi:hypothetical protein